MAALVERQLELELGPSCEDCSGDAYQTYRLVLGVNEDNMSLISTLEGLREQHRQYRICLLILWVWFGQWS